jgi:DNA-binding response OmpR family regulator
MVVPCLETSAPVFGGNQARHTRQNNVREYEGEVMSKPKIVVMAQAAQTHEELQRILADDFGCVAASTGVDGVALSRMLRPSLIVIDQHIPTPDVSAVCKALLSHEQVRSIPVVVIADAGGINGELQTLANVKGVVRQPLQAQEITAKIRAALTGKAPRTESGAKGSTALRDGPIRVLSVDDSSVVRKLVTMILTAEGFKVTTASDGVDGINKAKELVPDVILLDFVMPKMNGFQVCRILQKDEKLRHIPVILVTSKGDKVGDKFVDQLGVTGYITKPFQPEELVSKIHQTLESRGAPAEAGFTAPPSAPPQPAPVPSAPTQPAVPVRPAAESPSIAAESPGLAPGGLEARVAELVKAEVDKALSTLDKRIEKIVIEKMNEYIRRAKKK